MLISGTTRISVMPKKRCKKKLPTAEEILKRREREIEEEKSRRTKRASFPEAVRTLMEMWDAEES